MTKRRSPQSSHSLPSPLGLDPVRMKEMRTMMFPDDEEEDDELNKWFSHHRPPFGKESNSKPMLGSTPPTIPKTPLALLEYNTSSFASSPSGSILLAQQNKGIHLTRTKVQGFKLEIKETPVTRDYSRNVVDAALFMGRSSGIAWGPNGLLLLHCGSTAGNSYQKREMSSTIYLERVATDNVVRDEYNKVREELIHICFDSPLKFHKEFSHEAKEVVVDSNHIKIRILVGNCLELPHVCRFASHQVFVWELTIKVLFSSKESSLEADVEALPFIRRAEISHWLQETVCHRVQDENSSLNDSSDLPQLLLLLGGRQLDAAVEPETELEINFRGGS